jgi:threonine synthase
LPLARGAFLFLKKASTIKETPPVTRSAMIHHSTRGEAPDLGFSDALLAGLARDGGLYWPHSFPTLTSNAIADLAGRPYATIADRIISLYADDVASDQLSKMIHEAYATFRHPSVCPLVEIDTNLFVLELFRGPTLAFKDVAMQLLGRLMDHVLALRNERATIVGATSGDTGGSVVR